MKKLSNITKEQIKERGVQALADRPNTMSQYGQSGLTAAQLKLWFDKLATFLADKINDIQNAISGNEAGEYIRLKLEAYGIDNVDALVTAFLNGNFARDILKVYPSIGATQAVTLQTLLNNTALTISQHAEELSGKLDKVTEASAYRRAYIITPEGEQSVIIMSESPAEGHVPVYTAGGGLNVADPVIDNQAATKHYADTQDERLGCAIDGEQNRAEATEQRLQEQIDNMGALVPSSTSAENQLTNNAFVKAFVNSSLNNIAAFYIEYNAQGDAFPTKASLLNATSFYCGGKTRVPTQNDYAYVLSDESQPKDSLGKYPTTRYSYQTDTQNGTYPNGQWGFQYIVNNTSLTQAQVDAINSGITAELVKQFKSVHAVDSFISDTSENPVQNKVVKSYIDSLIAESITTALNNAV